MVFITLDFKLPPFFTQFALSSLLSFGLEFLELAFLEFAQFHFFFGF